MKECQIQGIIGSCCRKSESECVLKTYTQLDSERENLDKLHKYISQFEDCACQQEALIMIEERKSEEDSD